MLSDFCTTTVLTTLLTALHKQSKAQVAVLDTRGVALKHIGDLPFLCQIIHNKNAALCEENSRVHEEDALYTCEGGLTTISAPLFAGGEQIGSIVVRGIRSKDSIPDFSVIAERISVDPGELTEEYAGVPLTSTDLLPTIDSQLRFLAQVLPFLCTEELKSNRKIQSLSSFQKLHSLLANTTDFDGVLTKILSFVTTDLPFTHASIHLVDFKQAYLSSPMSFPREEIESRLGGSAGSYSHLVPNISKDFSLSTIEGADQVDKSVLCLPIGSADDRMAFFFCYGEADLALNDVEQELIEVLKLRFKDIIIKHLQLETAQKSAITDKLTHLFNRRYFNDRLGLELAECRETSSPISLIMCDLDHFKKLNDTFGHQKGDEVLSIFGKIVKTIVRRSDIACRYGGEEFSIILPKTPLSDAKMVATRIRESVESHDFGYIEENQPVTVSVGLATCSNGSIDANQLLKEADGALYRAKNLGRNRVECSLVVDKSIGAIDVNEVDDLYVQKSSDQ